MSIDKRTSIQYVDHSYLMNLFNKWTNTRKTASKINRGRGLNNSPPVLAWISFLLCIFSGKQVKLCVRLHTKFITNNLFTFQQIIYEWETRNSLESNYVTTPPVMISHSFLWYKTNFVLSIFNARSLMKVNNGSSFFGKKFSWKKNEELEKLNTRAALICVDDSDSTDKINLCNHHKILLF